MAVRLGKRISDSGGQASLGLARLLAQANQIAADSTGPDAENFDSSKWLDRWLEVPQPSLGGRRPSELIGTPAGLEIVSRLLGSLESGAYQ